MRLEECDPTHFWIELFRMWDGEGIKNHLIHKIVGLSWVKRRDEVTTTVIRWKENGYAKHRS